ncbi:MAG: hypothetical protein LBD01_03135 [Puniceicoccales bacterium]|jgi:hypothetical protein|nr:hypothetical protein [Puniceicoccales bacterium]
MRSLPGFPLFPALALAAASCLTAGTAAEPGLVGHWTFDDASGHNVARNTFPAKAKKQVKNIPGVHGQAVSISEANSWFEVVPEVLPENTREITFSAWIAPQALSGSIFHKNDSGRNSVDVGLLFSFQDSKFLSLGLNCGNNFEVCPALVSPEELLDGKWHHVAGTFDGKTMRVYLDGREIGSHVRQVPLTTVHDYVPFTTSRDAVAHSNYVTLESVTRRGEPLRIGSGNHKDDFFKGGLDDARFYTLALSARQIAALYAEGKQAPSPATAPSNAKAAKLYAKDDSFIATLDAIDKKLAAANATKPDAPTVVALQRLLRDDFPEETHAYISKWNHNPVDNLLLDQQARRARAAAKQSDAFEYLPLTDLQWSVLPKSEFAHWARAKTIQEQLSDSTKPIPGGVLFELDALIAQRPKYFESVARRVTEPTTPQTATRTSEEARAVLEADWLFQCDNKPSIAQALSEIGYARKILERIGLDATTTQAYAKQLDTLETQANSKAKESASDKAKDGNANVTDKDLYLAVRTLKREIIFKNPVLDFDSVLYIDNPNPAGREWNHETRHRLGYQAVPGGRLLVQKGLGPDGKLTQLAPTAPLHGTFWRPDLSFDASKVLFSYKPHNEKTFHIYEIGLDGTGLRQLTGGMFDDLDPIYLPDGKNIMFLTTRGHIYVRCMPPTNAFVTARMALDTKPGDKNLYIVSRNGEPEYTPSILNDGRVIFTRWEYTDKPLWRAQSLWTMNQNASNVQTFWGNQSVWPDLLKDARAIPGSTRVMFTGSAHHNWFAGSVGIIDPAKGLNFPDGLTKVTADVAWPESGNGPVDPKESPDYHHAGKYRAYYSPYPLSEKDFLVSAQRARGKFVLLFMDTDGNRELINEGAHNIWDAQPIRKRPIPPVQVDTLPWPKWEDRDNPQTGILYSTNVYEGADPAMKGKAKYLRIWSIEHKTYTYWFKRTYVSSGPEVSANQSEGVKKIIGTVPVEADGSVNFKIPSGIAVHFQLLDEKQRALQTMKSFTGVQPGETRGCFGCHELHMNTPVTSLNAIAMRRPPSDITPVPWEDITIGYERYVQPALDKYCGSCHADPSNEAYAKFNSALRPGFLGFKEPYMTLMGSPTWGSPYKKRKNTQPPYGWADTILVESYSTLDPKAYSTFPAMTKLSYKSRLVERMANGKHHGVKVDPDSLLRVILWVDAMGPYNGAEEIRDMEDPSFQGKDWISQRPRIHTAPIVTRPGPFDPFDPGSDPAYAAPSPAQYNRLPAGVKRN